jgi:hypothetical protein
MDPGLALVNPPKFARKGATSPELDPRGHRDRSKPLVRPFRKIFNRRLASIWTKTLIRHDDVGQIGKINRRLNEGPSVFVCRVKPRKVKRHKANKREISLGGPANSRTSIRGKLAGKREAHYVRAIVGRQGGGGQCKVGR